MTSRELKIWQRYNKKVNKILEYRGRKREEFLAEVAIIGASCSIPTYERGLPCTLISIGRVKLVFDYGDGATQKLLKFVDFSSDEIFIFFTHDHPDHWTGILALPGVIYTMHIEKKPIKKIRLFTNVFVANFLKTFLKKMKKYQELRVYFEINYINKYGICMDSYPNNDICFKTENTFIDMIKNHSERKRKSNTAGSDMDMTEYVNTDKIFNIKNFNNMDDFISISWFPAIHVPSSLAFRINVCTFPLANPGPANITIIGNPNLQELGCIYSIGITGDTKYSLTMKDFFKFCSVLICDCTFSKRLPNTTKSNHMTIEQAFKFCQIARIKSLIATHLHTDFDENGQDREHILKLEAHGNYPTIKIGKDMAIYRIKD